MVDQRICPALAFDMNQLIFLHLLWLLVVVVAISLIRGIVGSIPICHPPHLLALSYRAPFAFTMRKKSHKNLLKISFGA